MDDELRHDATNAGNHAGSCVPVYVISTAMRVPDSLSLAWLRSRDLGETGTEMHVRDVGVCGRSWEVPARASACHTYQSAMCDSCSLKECGT